MTQFTKVTITLDVYLPSDVACNLDLTETYLNDKLWEDPEFYGYIDSGCFTVTDESFNLLT